MKEKVMRSLTREEMKRTDGGYDLPEVEVVGDIKNYQNHLGEVYRDFGQEAAMGLVFQYWYYKTFGFL